MTATTTHHPDHHLHSLEMTLIGAFALAVLFVLCWVTSAYGNIAVPGAFVRLFTTEAVHSVAALYQGLLWAIVFGALGGALIALGSFLFQRRRQS
jgi:LPXTG-motif cell wall-anchored protein